MSLKSLYFYEKTRKIRYTIIGDIMFQNKKVLILGFARSGYQAAKLLISRHNTVFLNDAKEEEKMDPNQVKELRDLGVNLIFGNHPDDLLDSSFDYLIKNPGVPIDHKYVLKARELGIEVINDGLDKVLIKLADMLESIQKEPLYEEEKFESHVLYKFRQEKPFTIIKEGDVYVVKGEKIEKLLRMTWFASDEAFLRFSNKMKKMGIDDELKQMGIQNGDIIRILDYEFEYRD